MSATKKTDKNSKKEPECNRISRTEILIVGAGISGIAAGIALRRCGRNSFLLVERGDRVGGTWRDNTYPGVAADIPSSAYCFRFEDDFAWTRAFPLGHEIQAYVEHCARKYEISDHIRYHAEVMRAVFDETTRSWTAVLADGSTIISRFLIAATGLFSTPIDAEIPGRDTFEGKVFHSARWDHSHDLSGRRVAVIGTGASAVQLIPKIAGRVTALRVFQRTPVWVSPRPDYALVRADSPLNIRRFARVRKLLWWLSEATIEGLTYAVTHYRQMRGLVRTVQWMVRRWMRAQIRDPKTAASLLPDYTLGCKRPASSNTYLRTFNLDHVDLVTAAIRRIVAEGIMTEDGTVHVVDTIIMATGFLTTQKGNAPAFEVFGRGGVELGEVWQTNRLQSYRGVAVPGFPNFFLTAGPYSGGFNWFTMLDAHIPQITRCIEAVYDRKASFVEVDAEVHAKWMADMWRYADDTVFKSKECIGARSYYLDRHGDAALPLPRSPWWRVRKLAGADIQGFHFVD